jgi:hypothetical protein
MSSGLELVQGELFLIGMWKESEGRFTVDERERFGKWRGKTRRRGAVGPGLPDGFGSEGFARENRLRGQLVGKIKESAGFEGFLKEKTPLEAFQLESSISKVLPEKLLMKAGGKEVLRGHIFGGLHRVCLGIRFVVDPQFTTLQETPDVQGEGESTIIIVNGRFEAVGEEVGVWSRPAGRGCFWSRRFLNAAEPILRLEIGGIDGTCRSGLAFFQLAGDREEEGSTVLALVADGAGTVALHSPLATSSPEETNNRFVVRAMIPPKIGNGYDLVLVGKNLDEQQSVGRGVSLGALEGPPVEEPGPLPAEEAENQLTFSDERAEIGHEL